MALKMRNLCLTIAYDGTMYHGFQRQPEFHGPTIQGTLEKVWQTLIGEEIHIYTAGRTDTGVHAGGQVINFLSAARLPTDKIPKAFNSLLPRDIRVLWAVEKQEDFHARLSARWKRYDYLIDNRPIPDVFQRLYALHEAIPLKLEAMQRAARLLEGRHNFRAFAASGGSSKTFERMLYICRVDAQAIGKAPQKITMDSSPSREPESREEGLFSIYPKPENGTPICLSSSLADLAPWTQDLNRSLLRITCIGDGFLYNMVRIIAGTLLEVGKGKLMPEDIAQIIESQDRKKAGETAPAHGLTLSYVHYGEEAPLQLYPQFTKA